MEIEQNSTQILFVICEHFYTYRYLFTLCRCYLLLNSILFFTLTYNENNNTDINKPSNSPKKLRFYFIYFRYVFGTNQVLLRCQNR